MANLDPENLAHLIDKWRVRFGLSTDWSIGIPIVSKRKDAEKGYKDSYAYTHVREAYFAADITFHTWMFEDKDDEFLDLVVCHEVLHIVLHKMEHLVCQALGEDNEHISDIITENVVELLSRAFINLQRVVQ